MSHPDAAFQGRVLERYRHPQRRGQLGGRATHHGRRNNPLCGDEVEVDLRVADGRIVEVRQEGVGCAISQAAADLLAEHLEGKGPEALARLELSHIEALLGGPVSPTRQTCALLALAAAREALGRPAASPPERAP